MRVYLTGFMASGKSAVGRQMSRDCGTPFVDLDRRIEEKAGLRIPEIFEQAGEARFRALESEALSLLDNEGELIVATGGGVVISEENRRRMKGTGLVVWLAPNVELMLERIRSGVPGRRPLAGSDEEIRALYEARLEAYRDCDVQVEIGAADTVGSVAQRILRELESEE